MKNPIWQLSKKTWRYSKGNRKGVVLYIALQIIANTINFFQPLVLAWLLNIIQEQGVTQQNIPQLLWIASLFIAITLGFWTFHGPARVLERKNAFIARANYRKYLVDGTMDLPLAWHTDHHSGDTIDKIEKGSTALYDYAGHTFEIIQTILQLISSYLALTWFNLHSAYIVAFIVIATVTIILRFDEYLRKQYRQLFKYENKITAKIFDSISNITTVIILKLESVVSKEIWKKIMAPFGLYKKNVKINELKWFLTSLCTALMAFFVIGTYIYTNKNGAVLVGTVSALYGYVQRINQLFFRFAFRYGEFVRMHSAVENSEELSGAFESRKKVKQVKLDKWKKLQIDQLTFNYGDKDGELHLDNISLEIKKGEKIALVGESGSGKTTFMKLLRALYPAKKAKVTLDGKKLKSLESVKNNITLIPQEPELFATTVEENITLGIPYPKKEVLTYSKMAMFDKVAKRLPSGYESSIVEKGVNLSGGEKQRLALARGLIAASDKPIVLMDEPTSSVDSKNEIEIYKHVFKAFKGKTIISSIHRLHMLNMFDRIYLFKRGRIVARGTLEEMMQNAEFKPLWKKYTSSLK